MPADSIPAELSAACAQVRAATPADKIGGVKADVVAAPASTAEAGAVLKAASALGLAVVPRGGGTKLSWGADPERADLVIDTTRMNRVIEHAAGDLVASVEAGVTLDELARVLAKAGQRLALDGPGISGPGIDSRASTVGGVIATNLAGPLRLRYGAPRDLLIGITVVRADGVVARSGGKVVKNVAGYDLGKLFAGSRGTLGLITEATFRLHPIPASTGYVLAECADPADCLPLLELAIGARIAPVAAELDWTVLQTAPSDEPVRLAFALEGDEAGVARRAALLAEAIPGARVTGRPPWWGVMPPGHAGGTLLQLAFWAGALPEVLRAVGTTAHQAGLRPAVGGSAAAGLLHVAFPGDADPDHVAGFVTRLRADLSGPAQLPPRATVVALHAPARVAERIDLFGPVPALKVMRAVKQQFDPERLMSPGRFAGGL